MPKERITDVRNGAQRADGFNLPGVRVDTDDAIAVYEAAGEAVGRARDRNGPTLLEVQLHRRMGHFMGDAEGYRPDSDIDATEDRDSIVRLEADLRAHGIDDETLEELRSRAEERVEEAIEWAKDQPEPEPEDAYDDVFVNPVSGVAERGASTAETGGDDQ